MLNSKLLLLYLLETVTIFGGSVDKSTIDPEQVYCLAKNVYYESKGEDITGQFAVASVTINRTKDPRYPDTICEVVKQKTIFKDKSLVVCAFSWFCERDKGGDKEIPLKNKDGTINQTAIDQFQIAVMVSLKALTGAISDNTNGATHFHNPNISSPDWRKRLIRTARFGNHDFYKYPNYLINFKRD